jgi:hypothetical protein
MGQLPQDIEVLMNAEKILGATPNWDSGSDKKYVVFAYPLQIDGVTTGGFQLRVKVSKKWVDRDCMAQIELAPTRRTSVPLTRAEWRIMSQYVV